MFLRLTSSAFALSLAAAPALALTPEEVWTSWTSYYTSLGYTIKEGARDQAGETLTVKDAVFTHSGEDGSSVAITMPQVVMQGSGDGGVRTTLPEPLTMHVSVPDDEKKPVGVDLTITAPGMEVLSTGDAAKRTDKTTAPTLTVTVDKIDLPDDKPDLTKPLTLTATDLTGETVTEEGKSYVSSGRMAKLAYAIDITGEGNTVKGEGSLDGLEGASTIVLPSSGKLDLNGDLSVGLNDGATIDAKVAFGANTVKINYDVTEDTVDEPADAADGEAEPSTPASTPVRSTGTVAGSGAGGQLSFRLAKDGIGYQGNGTGLTAEMTSNQLPVPVSYKLDSASFEIQGPVSKSDTPQPFKLAYSLGGVTIADQIWDMIDPGKKLPRDPANLDIDVSGLTKVSADLFSLAHAAAKSDAAGKAAAPTEEDAAKAPAEAPAGATTESPAETSADADVDADATPFPFDPVALTVKQLSLSAVGAKISANGELTAPEGKTLDTPVGTLHARLEGVNTLIDTLVSMGLVPQEQVTGYRMMLAMFTKPVEGKDEMTSDIEFKEDGSVLANGQQIK